MFMFSAAEKTNTSDPSNTVHTLVDVLVPARLMSDTNIINTLVM